MEKYIKKLSPWLIVVAAVLWGTMGLFTRKLTALGYSTFDLMLTRASVTALFLTGYFLVFDRKKLKISFRDIPLFMMTSLLSCILFNYCYMTAIKEGSTGIASILLYTSPIFVTILSAVIFKEKITPMKIAALLCAFVGCIFVSGVIGTGAAISSKAFAFGIASGLTYGLYSIFTKIGLKRHHPLTFTAYTFIVSTLLLIPFYGADLINKTLSLPVADTVWLWLFGLVTNLIPYVCFTLGLKHMDAGSANITATIEPVVATVLGILVFQERLDWFSGLGILFVISGSVILHIKQKTPSQQELLCDE